MSQYLVPGAVSETSRARPELISARSLARFDPAGGDPRSQKERELPYAELLNRRLVIVAGKGGVGKSTVAVATGILAARRGLRTLIASTFEPLLLARTFGVRSIGKKPVRLADRLSGVWLDQELIFDEYIRDVVRVKMVFKRLKESLVYQYFAAAVPGLKELTLLDRIATLVDAQEDGHDGQPFDLVVVDSPATGHGASVLEVPQRARFGFSVGPITRMAERLQSLLSDQDRTAVVLVTLAEEMPVSETIELLHRLGSRSGVRAAVVVVNNFTPAPFADAGLEDLFNELVDSGGAGLGPLHATLPPEAELIAAARFQEARWQTNFEHIERLRRELVIPQVYVPFLAVPDDHPGGVPDLVARHLISTPDFAPPAVPCVRESVERALVRVGALKEYADD
ncbi:MAG: ArsA family ATPase [Candidatus Schekmanbacteria bacterium]|nr:ArsA family ATPase [Candidatus Schekmanbacteria bacterium]